MNFFSTKRTMGNEAANLKKLKTKKKKKRKKIHFKKLYFFVNI